MLKIESLIKPLHIYKKFSRDVIWNAGSFFVLGICGILINIAIAQFYDAKTLGVFNQVFALYIFFSQFAVFGIHLSVLKHVAQHSNDRNKCGAIIGAAVLLTVALGFTACVIAYLSSAFVGRILESSEVAKGWIYVIPGLWFFALNKVLIGVLNGYRTMRAFAVVQALRFILMMLFLAGFILFSVPSVFVPAIITAGEMLLFFIIVLIHKKLRTPFSIIKLGDWLHKHISFGAKSFLSGTLAELNSRVDILMLGYFTSDAAVGVYSMAAMIVEGIAQLAIVFRNNLNPVLAKQFAEKKHDEITIIIRKGTRLFYGGMFFVGIAACFFFPIVIDLLALGEKFNASWLPFCILMVGLVLRSGYIPFSMILIQAGMPGHHTILISLIVLTNIVLNFFLIPLYQINGAATATAIAFVLSAVYLKIIVWKKLRMRI